MHHPISTTIFTLSVTCVTTFTVRATALPTDPVGDDLWDVSLGAVVTAHTPLDGSTGAIAMLGGTYGQWEPTNVMFRGSPPPYAHYIEWQTSAPITLGAFNLFAGADGPISSDPSYCRRSFARFRLYAWDGAGFQNVFDAVPSLPYSWPAFSVVLGQTVTSDRWRVEFDQQVWTNPYLSPTGLIPGGYYGPRIIELDGFVPEPATLGLVVLGGIAVLRRRSRAA